MRLRGFLYLCITTAAMLALHACGNRNTGTASSATNGGSTTVSGTIKIVADESFEPVIRQAIDVFDSSNPQAKIEVQYLPEVQCFQNFFNGDAQMVIVARDLTQKESAGMAGKNIPNHSFVIAMDAIAVLTNRQSPDSVLTAGQVGAIAQGKFTRKYTVVYDNKDGSIARYIADSLTKGQPLSSQSYAAGNSRGVIEYVAQHPDAIGFVGVNHTYDPNSNSDAGTFVNTIRVTPLFDDSTSRFYQPYQAYIALGLYPLRRLVYVAMKDNKNELSNAFADFLNGERGQLIFKSARLVPMTVPLNIRPASLSK